MDSAFVRYACFALFGVFVGSVSQVLLKKSAQIDHDKPIQEYLNPWVITAYALFVASTLISTLAYKVIPLSMGPLIDATGYFYVTAFGIFIFKERLNPCKVLALVLILSGIVVFSINV